MKRLITIILLVGSFFAATAQNDDEVVGGTGDLSFDSQIAVAGNAAVNRMIGVSVYNEPYSRYFVECILAVGDSYNGGGISVAYLPKRLGGYASFIGTDETLIFSGGLALRPVATESFMDWQLYGGAAVGNGMGIEYGTRISANANGNGGAFSWLSGSVGRIVFSQTRYTTFGLSIDLASFLSLLFLL